MVTPTGCAFCDIIAGTAPAAILIENRATVIFRPLNPVTSGHVLVVPTSHVEDAGQNPLVSGEVMVDAARFARGLPSDYNIITSAGRAATQTVSHLHLHVLPRWPGDGLALPWTEQQRRAHQA